MTVCLVLLLICAYAVAFKSPGWASSKRRFLLPGALDDEGFEGEVEELTSKEIRSLMRKIEEAKIMLEEVMAEKKIEEEGLAALDQEYGPEISRVKNEFLRMKERAVEESSEIIAKAKADAVKEVLPISDNYERAKSVFAPIETPTEKAIEDTFNAIETSFQEVLHGFGLERVESLGQPFDFNFMEAIMAQPSTEYAENVVMTEYQVGYKMGDKSVRPAMVIVSQGPGPS